MGVTLDIKSSPVKMKFSQFSRIILLAENRTKARWGHTPMQGNFIEKRTCSNHSKIWSALSSCGICSHWETNRKHFADERPVERPVVGEVEGADGVPLRLQSGHEEGRLCLLATAITACGTMGNPFICDPRENRMPRDFDINCK